MSNRERAMQLIDQIPDSKLVYVIAYLEGAAIPETALNAETIEAPDEWDLKMIAEAKAENNGEAVSFDELLKKDGLNYADL